ncbi:MAG: DUF5679 domain-containing protein [bacterium]
MEGYCLKCRTKREITNPTTTTLKNGKAAVTGTCPTCGKRIFKIGVK